ncbi:MAG: hypothetical protein UHP27_09400 [Muribaculaceae bacterium]|nr:hypothetical protein [Muribaculaceae bacterium]
MTHQEGKMLQQGAKNFEMQKIRHAIALILCNLHQPKSSAQTNHPNKWQEKFAHNEKNP